MTFQKVILTIAVVGLILMLVIIGLSMYKSTSSGMVWPPMVGSCPDYWLDRGKGGSQCVVNAKKNNLGLARSPMDFSLPIYSGSNGPCVKYTWANKNKVSWDGITYGVPNPCIAK